MGYIPNYDEALVILKKYNKEPFHIKHGKTVGAVMGYFADKYDSYNRDFWQIVGLLHDLDFEIYPNEHCIKQVELMRDENLDEKIIRSTISHGYGMAQKEVEPSHIMEKILYTIDELTGIIGAAALMRPSKSVSDMNLKSVKKKFKDKKFAAGCDRELIKHGTELLDWDIDFLLTETLKAMQATEEEYNY